MEKETIKKEKTEKETAEQEIKAERSYKIAFRLMTCTVLLLLVFFIGIRFFEQTAAKRAERFETIANQTYGQTDERQLITEELQVNVNTASVYELTLLPGIGESRAKDIIAYRNEYGMFTQAEDLLKIKGIGDATLEKIRPYITF